MSDATTRRALAAMYNRVWDLHAPTALPLLDEPLACYPPEILFDRAAALGIDASWRVLDAGCGRGDKTVELASRFGASIVAIDLLLANLERAKGLIDEAGLGGRIALCQGSINAVPAGDDTFDLVWCRDMLEHVPHLPAALAECRRVLKPTGQMLLLSAFATERMPPQELAPLCGPLCLVRENLDQHRVEAALAGAGLTIFERLEVGGDFAEIFEQRSGIAGRELMRLSRLIRRRDTFEAAYGRETCDLAAALYTWLLHQLLGKVSFWLYHLRRGA
jgi:SAM-dependent methyltransferase